MAFASSGGTKIIDQLSIYGLLAMAGCILVAASARGSQDWEHKREAEYPDQSSVGQMIYRSNASGGQVHGQIGCAGDSPWPARPGHVKYTNLNTPETDRLYLVLRYSKNSPLAVPVDIYVDDETRPRASFRPADQGDWNRFATSQELDLGSVTEGIHSITLKVEGQQYGVLDLDYLILRIH
jgi:hypothetical protein